MHMHRGMEAMDGREESFKILMLPWLAYGHISPFLELAKRLPKSKFHIYLCSTPAALDAIKPNLPVSDSSSSSSIELVSIHVHSTPEFPPHLHTTKGLPFHQIASLMKAYEASAANLLSILEALKPDLLLIDIMLTWAPPIASSLNIPMVFFSIFSALTLAYVINRNRPERSPLFEFQFHDFWKSKHSYLYGEAVEPMTNHGFLEQSSEIILVKSCGEIEAKYVEFITESIKIKAVTTGTLAQQPPPDLESDIIDWLDKKPPFSTVYIAFGSERCLSKEESEEFAYGVEISGVNFIWVVRLQMGQEMELEEQLPKGFMERVAERGKVIEGWAPQAQILRHSSIGGHVSHCGWSSLMECMRLGVPVMCMPIPFDGPLCARLMEETGVGLEVKRDEAGRVTREELARVIKKVVCGESGKAFRNKAKEISRILAVTDEEDIQRLAIELARVCQKRANYRI